MIRVAATPLTAEHDRLHLGWVGRAVFVDAVVRWHLQEGRPAEGHLAVDPLDPIATLKLAEAGVTDARATARVNAGSLIEQLRPLGLHPAVRLETLGTAQHVAEVTGVLRELSGNGAVSAAEVEAARCPAHGDLLSAAQAQDWSDRRLSAASGVCPRCKVEVRYERPRALALPADGAVRALRQWADEGSVRDAALERVRDWLGRPAGDSWVLSREGDWGLTWQEGPGRAWHLDPDLLGALWPWRLSVAGDAGDDRDGAVDHYLACGKLVLRHLVLGQTVGAALGRAALPYGTVATGRSMHGDAGAKLSPDLPRELLSAYDADAVRVALAAHHDPRAGSWRIDHVLRAEDLLRRLDELLSASPVPPADAAPAPDPALAEAVGGFALHTLVEEAERAVEHAAATGSAGPLATAARCLAPLAPTRAQRWQARGLAAGRLHA